MVQEITLNYVEQINKLRANYDNKLKQTEQNLGQEFSSRLGQTESELNLSY